MSPFNFFVIMGLAVQLSARQFLKLLRATGSLSAALVIALVGVISIGSAFAQQQLPAEPQQSATDSTPPAAEGGQAQAMDYSKPLSISIPSIDVSSDLIQVGLNDDGTLETPQGKYYDYAAWYRNSPTPGQNGAAVIEGHIDSHETGPSIFYRLGELKAGDEVSVERQDGTTAEFSVTSVQSFAKNDFPSEAVYSSENNAPELRLITCGGDFDREAGDYTRNTVVYARLK
jgi:LPXTG-site transpeptidase (sortase) family protein